MGKHRLVVVLGVLTGVFAASCVGLAAYLIYREHFSNGNGLEKDVTPFNCPQNANKFRTMFRGYFLNAEDLSKLKQIGGKILRPVVNGSNWMPNVTSTQDSTNTTTAPGRKRRQTIPVGYCGSDVYRRPNVYFHACCVSYAEYDDPSSLPSGEPGIQGNVTIYQTPVYKQYFLIRYCCQRANCQTCQCNLVYQLTTAVVVEPNTGDQRCSFQLVRVPSCCMCLNN
ncbi:hypothetical protein ACOMHN_049523 [Nucella lapillus]